MFSDENRITLLSMAGKQINGLVNSVDALVKSQQAMQASQASLLKTLSSKGWGKGGKGGSPTTTRFRNSAPIKGAGKGGSRSTPPNALTCSC